MEKKGYPWSVVVDIVLITSTAVLLILTLISLFAGWEWKWVELFGGLFANVGLITIIKILV